MITSADNSKNEKLTSRETFIMDLPYNIQLHSNVVTFSK